MDFTKPENRYTQLHQVSAEYLASIRAKTKADPYYPSYHVAPHHGLLNDPNGLSYFNGAHHIFYQWFPLGPIHGLKHWYHVSTKDFVSYQDHGVALYPDQPYEKHGCYTGVGVNHKNENGDDALYLFYTANLKEDGERKPTQILAVMDKDNHIEKKGIVVDVPTEYDRHFRDPVIIQRGSDYHMLIGAQGLDNKGCLALYSGNKIDQYSHQGRIDVGLDDFGYMWECPNYFENDEHGVFLFSPQGVTTNNKYDLKNVYSVVYMVGKPIDFANRTFDCGEYIELDKGFDFYAPQIYKDNQNRTILLGWLGNSESEYPTDKNMWAHTLTLPRELSIEGDRLVQTPIKELEALRSETVAIDSQVALKSTAFELNLAVGNEFEIRFENAQGHNMVFAGNTSEFSLDRSQVSELHAEKFGTVRFAKRLESAQNVRIFVDNSTIEIFADSGKTAFTSRIFIQDLSCVKVTGAKGELHYLASMVYS